MTTATKQFKLIDRDGGWVLSFNLGDYGHSTKDARTWINQWATYQSTCGEYFTSEKFNA